MKNLITLDEYITETTGYTTNYAPPEAVVVPPPDDKIWQYIKAKIDQSPVWGLKYKDQEKSNRKIRD